MPAITPTGHDLIVRHARSWNLEETNRLYDICVRTGANGEDARGLYRNPRLLGEVFVGPYLAFEPSLAFVLDDGVRPVGYILGTRNTAAFEARCERSWWPKLRRLYPPDKYAPGSLDAHLTALIQQPSRTDPALLTDFPAHLHVDLLPRAQGNGNGRRLMERLFTALRERDVPGVHLGVSASNEHAIGFYTHLGFREVASGPGSILMAREL